MAIARPACGMLLLALVVAVVNSVPQPDNMPPMFANAIYNRYIQKDMAAGTKIDTLSAFDYNPDDKLTYSLSSFDPANGADFFEIDATTGDFKLKADFPEDVPESFKMHAVATDNGGLSAEMPMYVSVVDPSHYAVSYQ